MATRTPAIASNDTQSTLVGSMVSAINSRPIGRDAAAEARCKSSKCVARRVHALTQTVMRYVAPTHPTHARAKCVAIHEIVAQNASWRFIGGLLCPSVDAWLLPHSGLPRQQEPHSPPGTLAVRRGGAAGRAASPPGARCP